MLELDTHVTTMALPEGVPLGILQHTVDAPFSPRDITRLTTKATSSISTAPTGAMATTAVSTSATVAQPASALLQDPIKTTLVRTLRPIQH